MNQIGTNVKLPLGSEVNGARQPRRRGTGITGPRTPAGKQRSSRNAVKNGIFSDVLLPWESSTQYKSLNEGFRLDFQPVGTFENRLVDRLVILEWRRQRLIKSEVARTVNSGRAEAAAVVLELSGAMSCPDPKVPGLLRTYGRSAISTLVPLLRSLRQKLETEGWDEIDPLVLKAFYDDDGENKAGEDVFYNIYQTLATFAKAVRMKSEGKLTALTRSPDEIKKIALGAIDEEIMQLEFRDSVDSHLERIKVQAERSYTSFPSDESTDRLIRYEAHLSREFDRTLSQLERHQRVRLGQSVLPAIKLDLSS